MRHYYYYYFFFFFFVVVVVIIIINIIGIRSQVNQCLLRNDSPCSPVLSLLCRLTPVYFTSFSRESNRLNFGLSAFLLCLVSPEILYLLSYHQTFLPDDQPILVSYFIQLQYLVFCIQPDIHHQFGLSSHLDHLLGHISCSVSQVLTYFK